MSGLFLMTLGKKFETNLELVLFFVIPKNILSWAEKMFQVRNFFFNVHIRSRSSEYISDIFVRFGVIGNLKKFWLFAIQNVPQILILMEVLM